MLPLLRCGVLRGGVLFGGVLLGGVLLRFPVGLAGIDRRPPRALRLAILTALFGESWAH